VYDIAAVSSFPSVGGGRCGVRLLGRLCPPQERCTHRGPVSAPFELTVQDGPLEKGRTMDEAAMPQDSKKVRVVVADDHPLYREGVVRALSTSGQVAVVAEAEDGRSALSEIEHHQP